MRKTRRRVSTRAAAMSLALGGWLAFAGSSARADIIWTDWTSGTSGPTGSALGVLHIGSTDVTVTYTGENTFLQTNGGTNYWSPSAPYISATVPNAPPDTDIIALSLATSRTITFSQAVTDPVFAVVSLNGNGYRFNHDFDILSFGAGYWGNGVLSKQVLGGGLFELDGSGEPHGVIQFHGTFSSLTWDSLTNENWNGFTMGVVGLAAVPEPSSMALMVIGGGSVALWARKHRKARPSAPTVA